MAGCQAASAQPTTAQAPSSAATQPLSAFPAWLDEVKAEAARQGIGASTLNEAFRNVEPIARVIELDRRQPEFTQTFGRYLASAVSERRVNDGRAMLARHRKLLSELEWQYGIPARFLVAFWGLETNYGGNLGAFPVIGALSTLGFDGRRGPFFRDELLKALTILDRGHTTADRMIGSWAGAMGQTQFMPSTFLGHAIDHDGDGKIDVWSSTADALGSGANYLHNLGWAAKWTWGREVRLPPGFDASLVSIDTLAREIVKPLAAWRGLGVRAGDGSPLPTADVDAAIVLPAGIVGPAFAVYDNYRVILRWNRAMFYALAIGHLADRLGGAGPLASSIPSQEPLPRTEIERLQTGLVKLGHLSGEIDGVLGSATRAAVREFQLARNLPADGFADAALIETVSRAAQGV